MINESHQYCYRVTHIENLPLLIQNGIVSKHHPKADKSYINIGHIEIVGLREKMNVKLEGYGHIGEYVPFYFTPRSIMLLNIITGVNNQFVPKRAKDELLIICCNILKLTTLPNWFFTDGQGNNNLTKHYNDMTQLGSIDWESIVKSDFSKKDNDIDRFRRYQAEFLVHNEVPISYIDSLYVFNKKAFNYVTDVLNENSINLPVNIQTRYFF